MPRMNRWERLVLVGFQVKRSLEKAVKKYEEDFRDPLKAHLETLPAGHQELIAAGLVKAMLVTSKAGPVVDAALVQDTFISALQNGAVSDGDLRTLFDAGALGVTDLPRIITLLNLRGIAGDFMRTPDASEHVKSLKITPINTSAVIVGGVLEGLDDQVHAAAVQDPVPAPAATTTEQAVVAATRRRSR